MELPEGEKILPTGTWVQRRRSHIGTRRGGKKFQQPGTVTYLTELGFNREKHHGRARRRGKKFHNPVL